MKAFLPELPELWPKECQDCYELLPPPPSLISLKVGKPTDIESLLQDNLQYRTKKRHPGGKKKEKRRREETLAHEEM